MKSKRQGMILELIRDNRIETQEDLQALLSEKGFAVTQATVSRDIRELNIVKSAGEDGTYRYHVGSLREQASVSETFRSILRQAAHSADAASNLVVVKTYAGMGNAVGAAVDAMKLPDCLGTLAGDDTLLLIAKSSTAANEICSILKQLMKKEAE